jgi:hypothetical protein
VHVRVGLVVVQHHHVLVVRQLDLGELARRALHARGSVPLGIDSMMLKASRRSPMSSMKVPPIAPVVSQPVKG